MKSLKNLILEKNETQSFTFILKNEGVIIHESIVYNKQHNGNLQQFVKSINILTSPYTGECEILFDDISVVFQAGKFGQKLRGIIKTFVEVLIPVNTEHRETKKELTTEVNVMLNSCPSLVGAFITVSYIEKLEQIKINELKRSFISLVHANCNDVDGISDFLRLNGIDNSNTVVQC